MKIGIIINHTENLSKSIKAIREYKEQPISAITANIKEQKPILFFNTIDTNELKMLIDCYDRLTALGDKVSFTDSNGIPNDIELMRNLYKSHLQTEKEVWKEIEREANNES